MINSGERCSHVDRLAAATDEITLAQHAVECTPVDIVFDDDETNRVGLEHLDEIGHLAVPPVAIVFDDDESNRVGLEHLDALGHLEAPAPTSPPADGLESPPRPIAVVFDDSEANRVGLEHFAIDYKFLKTGCQTTLQPTSRMINHI